MLKCVYKGEFVFNIDTENDIVFWNGANGELKQFINGLTNEVSSIAGVNFYSETTKIYSFFTPHIYKKDITQCNDWVLLNDLFTTIRN